jgi:hypothetical protein
MPGPIYREPFNDAVHLRRRFAPAVAAVGANYDVAWSLSVATALAAAAVAAELSTGGFAGSAGHQSQVQRTGYASGALAGAGVIQATASGAGFGAVAAPAAASQTVGGGKAIGLSALLAAGGWIDYAGAAGEYAGIGLDAGAGLVGVPSGGSLGYAELSSAAIGASGQESCKATGGLGAAAGLASGGAIVGAAAGPLAALAIQQGTGANGLKASSALSASADHEGVSATLLRAMGAMAAGAAVAALVGLDHVRRRLAVVFMRTWR